MDEKGKEVATKTKLEVLHQRPNGDLVYVYDDGISNLGKPLTMKKLIERVEDSNLTAAKKTKLKSLINAEFPSGKTTVVRKESNVRKATVKKDKILPLETFPASARAQKIGYILHHSTGIFEKVRGGWRQLE